MRFTASFLPLLILSVLTLSTCFELKKTEQTQHQRRIRDLTKVKKSKTARQDAEEAGIDVSLEANSENGKDGIRNRTQIPNPEKKKRRPSRTIKYLPFSLPEKYDKLQIPRLGLGLALVDNDSFTSDEVEMFESFSHLIRITLRIKTIDDVDENEEEISFAVDLIITWIDEVIGRAALVRFGVNSEEFKDDETQEFFRTLDPIFLNQIWKPDVYIRIILFTQYIVCCKKDLVKVHHPDLVSQPITLRVNEATGEVNYIATLRIHMKCEMDFHFYPADTQTCEVILRSNSYTYKELTLLWSSETFGVTLDDCGGSNFDFQVKDVLQDVLREDFISGQRKFSVLRFNIAARRKLSYHMVQTFIPSTFFIVITWLCFLIPSPMLEAKIGISMTTLFTLTAMFASVRESSPIVSYVRYIDYWMTGCIIFVFFVLLEFSVLYCLRHLNEKTSGSGDKKSDTRLIVTGDEEVVFKTSKRKSANLKVVMDMGHKIAEFIDEHAFIMFSLIFTMFAVLFWVILLVKSNYFGWSVDTKINCGDTDCKFESNLAEDCTPNDPSDLNNLLTK